MKRKCWVFVALSLCWSACAVAIEPASVADQLQRAFRVTVEVPESYELANIALALSDFSERERHTVWREGTYYEEVREQFGPHRGHPLIARLNKDLRGKSAWRSYYSFRENSASSMFQDGRLVRVPDLPAQIWSGPNVFTRNRKLVEEFAEQTGFREFYRRHRPFYEDEIRRYEALVPISKMWEWLEARFPSRYDRYRIVFSPLIYGSHSTQRFSSHEGQEAIMFVAGPDVVSAGIPPELRGPLLARVVFTEIDHNYVNPTTDRHRQRVDRVFHAMAKWSAGDALYASPYQTFNEYMTWAVFDLFASDTYDRSIAEAVNRIVVRQMEGSRGFLRFGAFDRKLLELYTARGPGVPISDLYDSMLDWAAEQR